jgi:hypothetical protein
LLFIESTYKTIEDAKFGCTPSDYVTRGGRIGNATVKSHRLYEGARYAKHKGGQMVASSNPPVTITKCIGFGKKKKKKEKRKSTAVINPDTGEEISCDDLIGSGTGPPGGGTGVDPCAEQDAAAGLGDQFSGVGSDFTIYSSLEEANAALGGHGPSGVPQQVYIQLPGKPIIPTKSKCNAEQRRIDLNNSIALADAGFVGTGLGESGQLATNDFVVPF